MFEIKRLELHAHRGSPDRSYKGSTDDTQIVSIALGFPGVFWCYETWIKSKQFRDYDVDNYGGLRCVTYEGEGLTTSS